VGKGENMNRMDGIYGKMNENLYAIYSSNYLNLSPQAAVKKNVDNSFKERLEKAVDERNDEELKKACDQFEGILLNMMYKQMKATVIRSDLFERDLATDIFENMLDDTLTEKAAEVGSLGLSDMLYRQLSAYTKTDEKKP